MVCACVGGTCALTCMGRLEGWRTTLWGWFSLSTFMWFLQIEVMLVDLGTNRLYLLSHHTGTVLKAWSAAWSY